MKIGFIGVGVMGGPMVLNLMKKGFDVSIYTRTKSKAEGVIAAGAHWCDTIADCAAGRDVVITIVGYPKDVEEVYFSEKGILNSADKGTVLIDMTTTSPRLSERIYAAAKEKGMTALDAPVSGGEPKAIDGTLSIMCGGPKALFDTYSDLLKVMGASVVHCGDVNGAGNTVKLANQIIVACNIAACAEAYSLSTMAGVDPEKVFEAIRGGLAGSTVMNAKVPMMMEGNFKPGFRIDLHIKDLNNALDTGHGLGTPMILTSQVQEMMQWLHNNGCGSDDHSAILKYYERITGTEVRKEH